jgi:hypothetical protein
MSGNTDTTLQRTFPQPVPTGPGDEGPSTFAFDVTKPHIDQTRKDAIDSTRANFDALAGAADLTTYMPKAGGTFTGQVQGMVSTQNDPGNLAPTFTTIQWVGHYVGAADWSGMSRWANTKVLWLMGKSGIQFWTSSATMPALDLTTTGWSVFNTALYIRNVVTAEADGQTEAGNSGVTSMASTAGNSAIVRWFSGTSIHSVKPWNTNSLTFTHYNGSVSVRAVLNCGRLNTGHATSSASTYSTATDLVGTARITIPAGGCAISTPAESFGTMVRLLLDCTAGLPTWPSANIFWPAPGTVPAWQSGPRKEAMVSLMYSSNNNWYANVTLY